MKLIDTHAHLDHCENVDQALAHAAEAGVEAVIAVSEDLASSQKNLDISKKGNATKVYAAAGIHPSEANLETLNETLDFIRHNANDLIAVGELGLDYWYKWVRKDQKKKEEQRTVFKECLKVAKELDLPVTFHSRGAWRDCLDIVKEGGNAKCVFHWYSGPIDVLDEILDAGFLISATPSLLYSPEAQAAVKHAPIEQTMIETDTPVYYRNRETGEGFKSEPKDVFVTFQQYCKLKDLNPETASEKLNKNAIDFFGLK